MSTTALPEAPTLPPLPNRPRAPRRTSLRLASRVVTIGTVAAVVVGLAYLGWKGLGGGVRANERPLAVAAHRATLRVVVTERGNLESTVTVDGICEMTGHQNKIIEIVAEGTKVKKGDVVCRFDTSEIEKNVAQQEIKSRQAKSKIETQKQEIEIALNKGEGEIKDAEVEWKLAKGNLEKYQQSDYKAEIFEIQGNIAQQTSKAEEAKTKYEQTKELVKKGFRSPEQLRGAKTEHDQFDFFLKQFTEKLKSKEKYEYKLKSLELTSKVEQAEGKMKRAGATAKASVAKAQSEYDGAVSTYTIEDQQLKEFLKQREKSILKAEQAGVVAYANDRWYDPSSRIREGAMVYSRQKIYSLPDMTKMQVKANIHESLVKKVKAGQKAEIRVDAFPNMVLSGVVKSVSPLADSNQSFGGGGSKEYTTYVTIEKMPDEGLKPSMTAEVRIQVSLVNNALVVPLQAVVDHKGDHYAFVEDKAGAIKRRLVKIGETNEKDVQVLEGLADGERVVLDARLRAETEFKDEIEKEGPAKPPPSSPGAATAGGP